MSDFPTFRCRIREAGSGEGGVFTHLVVRAQEVIRAVLLDQSSRGIIPCAHDAHPRLLFNGHAAECIHHISRGLAIQSSLPFGLGSPQVDEGLFHRIWSCRSYLDTRLQPSASVCGFWGSDQTAKEVKIASSIPMPLTSDPSSGPVNASSQQQGSSG